VARGCPGKEKSKTAPFEKPNAKGCGTQGLPDYEGRFTRRE